MIIKGEEKTKELGRKLAEEAAPGAVYALVGDLGAGKTTLTKAIAEGLGVSEPITSPTFTIVREYDSLFDREAVLSFFDNNFNADKNYRDFYGRLDSILK